MDDDKLLTWSTVEDTRQGVAPYLCDHQLTTRYGGTELKAWMYVVPIPSLVLSLIGYGCGVRVGPVPLPGFHAIIVPTRGHGRVHCGQRTITIEPDVGVIASPGQRLELEFSSDAVLTVLRIDEPVVSRARQNVFGYEPHDSAFFQPVFDARLGPRLILWNRIRACLSSALLGEELVPGIEEILANALLATQPYSVVPRSR